MDADVFGSLHDACQYQRIRELKENNAALRAQLKDANEVIKVFKGCYYNCTERGRCAKLEAYEAKYGEVE